MKTNRQATRSLFVELIYHLIKLIYQGHRIRTGKLSVNKGIVGGMEQQIAHQVLNVANATEEDEGYYECQTIDHTGKFELTKVFIKIHGKFCLF